MTSSLSIENRNSVALKIFNFLEKGEVRILQLFLK